MLVFHYLTREILKTQLAILLILLLIFISQQFIRMLAHVVDGEFPVHIISSLLLISVPKLTQLMLPISFYLGTLFTLSRLHVEHEMTACYATGYSPLDVLRAVLFLGVCTGIIAFVNAWWFVPQTSELKTQLLQEAQENISVEHLKAGQFTVLQHGSWITYVTDKNEQGQFENLFFIAQNTQMPFIILAKRGQIKTDDRQQRWLTLENGIRYANLGSGASLMISKFSQYEMPLPDLPKPSFTKTQGNEAYLEKVARRQWQLAMPLSIPLLGLIALPLAVSKPRQGRFSKLLPAILVYLSLYLLLGAAKSGVQKGLIPTTPGVYGVLYLLLGGIAFPLWRNTFHKNSIFQKLIARKWS